MNNPQSHIKRHEVHQTGGMCMVDVLILNDNTSLGITDEVVVLYEGEELPEDESCIGMIDILHNGHDVNIKYPTAYRHNINVANYPGYKGYYVKLIENIISASDIYWDFIFMRNGIVIIIGLKEIALYTNSNWLFSRSLATIKRP